jgi:hypothetical protein
MSARINSITGWSAHWLSVRLVIFVSQRNSQEEDRKAFVAHLELLKDLFELRIDLADTIQ